MILEAPKERLFSLFFVALPLLFLLSCQHDPYRAKKINTQLKKSSSVRGNEKIGVKNQQLIIQKKVMINEQLRQLQNDVHELEDKVYGNKKYGSEGLYGHLKRCKRRLSSKEYGGDGKLIWTEAPERITDKEQKWNIGFDEKGQLVGVSKEFLKNRIEKFRNHKHVLEQREMEYKEKIEICETTVQAKIHDMNKKRLPIQPSRTSQN